MTTRKAKAKPERPAPRPDEAAAIKAAIENRDKRPVRPTVALDGSAIQSPHSDPAGWTAQVHDALGTRSYDFAEVVIKRLEPLVRERGGASIAAEDQINAAIAILAAVNPANELEAAMGEQMVAAHLLSMEAMRMAIHTETVPKMEAYVTMATKLSRTFTGQIEALAKLRSGGKQQVIVKHVYVNGNAIVADNANTVMRGVGETKDPAINPMRLCRSPMDQAPRCCAKTRSGRLCQSPAVKGRKRCRMHGGTNPGAPKGKANGRYVAGYHTQEVRALRAQLRSLMAAVRGCG